MAKQEIRWSPRGGVELVRMPMGSFTMGLHEATSRAESAALPMHDVVVQSFSLSRYAITNAEFGRYLAAADGGSEPEYWANDLYNRPEQAVTGISWLEARLFAAWAGGRLPSEAEWEFAHLGEHAEEFFRKEDQELCFYEWVEDDWHENYDGAPSDGSAWVDEPRAADRVFRTAEIAIEHEARRSSLVEHAIAGSRDFNPPELVSPEIGFRIACD